MCVTTGTTLISLKSGQVVNLKFDQHKNSLSVRFEDRLISSLHELIASQGEVHHEIDHEEVGVRKFVSI